VFDFPGSGDNPWQTRASRIAFDNGRVRLREDTVVQPDGRPGSYTYIELPNPVVAMVPLSANGLVHMVRQWRYVWRQNSWEIPAGHCEPNEAPQQAARRELAEEAGIQAERWDELSHGFATAASAARVHLYLARDLTPLPAPVEREGAEGDLIARAVPLERALAAIEDGTIVHAYTIIGLLRAARLLGV
jgi:ADP-ribose pyrophosphatase